MLIAYHNDPKVKKDILAQLQQHYDRDEIVQGRYWEDGKGCAVGCTVHSSDHGLYPLLFGIPVILARLEDDIFELLPNHKAKEWPIAFMSAIKPGQDLSLVVWRLLHWTTIQESVFDPKHEMVRYDIHRMLTKFFVTGKFDENEVNRIIHHFNKQYPVVMPAKAEYWNSIAKAMFYHMEYEKSGNEKKYTFIVHYLRDAFIRFYNFDKTSTNLCDQLLTKIRAAPMAPGVSA